MTDYTETLIEDGVLPVLWADMAAYRIAYRDTGGEGIPVVFLHALAGSSASWMPQLSAFHNAGYRAIAPDRRGWGDSSLTNNDATDIGTAAQDLDDFVNMLGIDRFHLVAVAGGGFVALDYAAWRSERLINLVVAASTGDVSEAEIRDFSQRISIPGVVWPSVHLEVGASYMGSNPEGTAKWEEIYHFARRQQAPVQPLRSSNTYDKIRHIDVPTLAIAGGGDLLAPPALMRLWTSHLPQCVLKTIAPAGHSINWEHPQDFNRMVLNFISTV